MEHLRFPVLCFSQNLALVTQTEEDLTTCSKVGLRNGYFDNLLLVDSSGRGVRVKGAKKLHGIGPFWGYNMFLNQTIKVELIVAGEPFKVSLEEVKERVLDSFKKWHGWEARGDFEELRERITNAKTIPEIIRLLSDDSV